MPVEDAEGGEDTTSRTLLARAKTETENNSLTTATEEGEVVVAAAAAEGVVVEEAEEAGEVTTTSKPDRRLAIKTEATKNIKMQDLSIPRAKTIAATRTAKGVQKPSPKIRATTSKSQHNRRKTLYQQAPTHLRT